jgi:hypothetical protein
MGWRCGSSSRAPALQAQNPEFKSQSHQKKKKENTIRVIEIMQQKGRLSSNYLLPLKSLEWILFCSTSFRVNAKHLIGI